MGWKIFDILNICNINLLGNVFFGYEVFKVMEVVVVVSMFGEF